MEQTQILILQRDAFCEHTMLQNATAAGAPTRTPLGQLTALPRPSGWFSGERFAAGRGSEERGREEGK